MQDRPTGRQRFEGMGNVRWRAFVRALQQQERVVEGVGGKARRGRKRPAIRLSADAQAITPAAAAAAARGDEAN